MRYSCAGSRPQISAVWGSSVMTIQSAVGGSAALRYADLMSMVAMWSFRITASCRNKEKVIGMMLGLQLAGMGTCALIIARRSVSLRAAARALCLSGSPFGFFFRLHFRVVRIFQNRLINVRGVSNYSLGLRLEGFGFRYKAVDLFLNYEYKLIVVRCAECLHCLNFLRVSGVVLGGE